MSQPKIGIIGASIAGSAVAILLERLGFNIQVFEKRGPESMKNLGAGIVLPPNLVNFSKENNLFDQDFPSTKLTDRLFFLNLTSSKPLAKIPMSGLAINWSILYDQLAKRLPKNKIFYHSKISQIEQQNKSIVLTINGSQRQMFDFVIAADGYRSIARNFLFPQALPEFSDYTCWQGNFTTDDNEIKAEISNHAFYYLYEKGILLAYVIPSLDSKNKYTTITWFLYETTESTHPFYRDNKIHTNIYQDDMEQKYIDYLHQLARKSFPLLGQKIVCGTQKPFTHVIYDTMVEKYFSNNIALMGDAGILLRPHIGSGATKALQDAFALYQFFKKNEDITESFCQWGKARQQTASHLYELSRAFGSFLVKDHPQWDALNSETFCNLWNKICEGYNWYQNK